MTGRSGAVDLGSGQKQHVDLWCKVKLRREILELARLPGPGAAFVPYLGEGDIAAELYGGRRIVGVELDPDVAHVAEGKLAPVALGEPLIIVGDAETWHRAAVIDQPYAIADVDAFANPYRCLSAFWRNAETTDRVAIFGTDGMRLAIARSRSRRYDALPDGRIIEGDISARRVQVNGWWSTFVLPYLTSLFAPATIVESRKYLRGQMCYWGVVVERARQRQGGATTAEADGLSSDVPSSTAPSDPITQVEAALLEAARSGNVPAAMFWLEHRGGPAWQRAAAGQYLDRITGPIRARVRRSSARSRRPEPPAVLDD